LKDSFLPMASSPYFSLAVLFVAALGFGLARWGWRGCGEGVFSGQAECDQEPI